MKPPLNLKRNTAFTPAQPFLSPLKAYKPMVVVSLTLSPQPCPIPTLTQPSSQCLYETASLCGSRVMLMHAQTALRNQLLAAAGTYLTHEKGWLWSCE